MDISELGVGKTAFVRTCDRKFALDEFAVAEAATAGTASCRNGKSRFLHRSEQSIARVRLDIVYAVLNMNGKVEFLRLDVS